MSFTETPHFRKEEVLSIKRIGYNCCCRFFAMNSHSGDNKFNAELGLGWDTFTLLRYSGLTSSLVACLPVLSFLMPLTMMCTTVISSTTDYQPWHVCQLTVSVMRCIFSLSFFCDSKIKKKNSLTM